jgi:hypothetical protein
MPVMACTGLREVRPVCWCYLGEENERVRCVRGLDRGGGGEIIAWGEIKHTSLIG